MKTKAFQTLQQTKPILKKWVIKNNYFKKLTNWTNEEKLQLWTEDELNMLEGNL